MAGLLLGCVTLRGGLSGCQLPLQKGILGQHEHPLQRSASSAFVVVAAACDSLAPVAELGGAVATSMAVSNPPRTYNHTRRLTVPAYALSGTRTRRRRSRGSGGGDDDELGGGGGDDGFWGSGGNDGNGGGGDFWGGSDGGEGEDSGAAAARLQDLLLLWSIFCGLAFCQTVWHVSPKPKNLAAPAFAALSYSGIKAQLLTRVAAQPAC